MKGKQKNDRRFYDYTVILTYISLLCSMFGITQAIDGRFRTAIVALQYQDFVICLTVR